MARTSRIKKLVVVIAAAGFLGGLQSTAHADGTVGAHGDSPIVCDSGSKSISVTPPYDVQTTSGYYSDPGLTQWVFWSAQIWEWTSSGWQPAGPDSPWYRAQAWNPAAGYDFMRWIDPATGQLTAGLGMTWHVNRAGYFGVTYRIWWWGGSWLGNDYRWGQVDQGASTAFSGQGWCQM